MTERGLCMWCEEPVTAADAAIEMAAGTWHKECAMRMVVGSIGHLDRKCSCYVKSGPTEDDPPGLTRREAASVAARRFAQLGDTDYPKCSPYKFLGSG